MRLITITLFLFLLNGFPATACNLAAGTTDNEVAFEKNSDFDDAVQNLEDSYQRALATLPELSVSLNAVYQTSCFEVRCSPKALLQQLVSEANALFIGWSKDEQSKRVAGGRQTLANFFDAYAVFCRFCDGRIGGAMELSRYAAYVASFFR